MRTLNIITYLFAATLATAASAFEAHEWGTFTSLVGSDGITQNGMLHEDEPLPSFVYKFGETRRDNNVGQQPPPPPCRPNSKICLDEATLQANVITQKMETPVIYFYAQPQEKPLDVTVNVRFPEGVVTESFPGPIATSPARQEGVVLANGNTTYSLQIVDNPFNTILLPFVAADNIYGHARNVRSDIVRSGDEYERFLFYRGVGRFQPRIQISSQGGSLRINTPETAEPQAIFLVNVDAQLRARGMRLNTFGNQTVDSETIRKLRHPTFEDSVSVDAAALRAELIQELIFAGLSPDEANAMLNTWEHGYLRVPGLRLLYILPKSEVEQILPVTFTPAPERFHRAFVARVEVMLDKDERALVKTIDQLQESFRPEGLGRFAEPMLRRIREVAFTMKLQSTTLDLIDRLIQQVATAPSAPGGVQ